MLRTSFANDNYSLQVLRDVGICGYRTDELLYICVLPEVVPVVRNRKMKHVCLIN